jgi:hypothetical protein
MRALVPTRGLLPGGPSHPAIKKSSSLFLLIAALLALSWQSIVGPVHLLSAMPSQIQATTAGVHAPVSLPDSHRQQRQPADCPICQALLTAAQYVLPSIPSVIAPNGGVAWLSPTDLTVLAVNRPSHFWQSRGPPRTLQN